MKCIVNGYQVLYDSGSRDKVKLAYPIYTTDIESLRMKLKNKHSGLGKKCVGLNLEYTELNDRNL